MSDAANLAQTSGAQNGALNAQDPITTLIQGEPFTAILVTVFLLFCGLLLAYFVLRQVKKRRDQSDLAATLRELPQEEPSPSETKVEPQPESPVESWSERLYAGLGRTRTALANSIGGLFSSGAQIGDELLERVHEALYRADLGVQTTDFLVAQLREAFGGRSEVSWDQVRPFLVEKLQGIFGTETPTGESTAAPDHAPHVILVVGVNGVGKTTTIGKLTAWYQSQGKKVLLGAGDTFRAAAIDQLQTWADRTGADLVRQQPGSDPAAVAFDAVKAGKARGADVVIIDTAGRLHSKEDLMAELAKINRSIAKELPGAPHDTMLVIDATTGQNAVQQVRAFSEVVKLTGLVATKLDGTAKGGVLVGIAQQFKIPVSFIGVGEKVTDLQPFDAKEFVEAMI